MIWLASYPRSGNTFFRIVLSEVYGIESSTFHNEPNYPVDDGYEKYPVVKTHLLPHQLTPPDSKTPVVYLVRDGRDVIVSLAHQRKSFQDPFSNLTMNMEEAILASKGSYFGGWSKNVSTWVKRADIVIRFEDLIVDPIGEVEKLRAVIELPQPRAERLPGFKDLKSKEFMYGTGVEHEFKTEDKEKHRNFFFRRGKAGGWKDEMTPDVENLFWEQHGKVMEQMGYLREEIPIKFSPEKHDSDMKHKVLIEATKAAEKHVDGGKRYVSGLIEGLERIRVEWEDSFEFDLSIKGRIYEGLDLHDGELPLFLRIRQEFLRWLFNTKFSNFLLWIKEQFPGLWKIAKRVKEGQYEDPSTKYSKYDLVHITVPQIFFEFQNLIPAVLTVHDYSHTHFPEFHINENVKLAEKGMSYFILKPDTAFIAISESTKKDMQEVHSIEEDSIELIYEASDYRSFFPVNNPNYFEPVKKKYNLPDGKYLLCLSTIEPRKNLINTIEAFLMFLEEYPDENIYLVVAGKKGWKYEELFTHPIDTERILFTGYIDEPDISVVYSGALAFLYVSFYEGFGLPLLEAMSCGVPVIYGNNSSMPEIAGEGGLPADPEDIGGISRQIERVVKNNKFREQLSENALEQAMNFSWAKTARETLALYREIAERKMGKTLERE